LSRQLIGRFSVSGFSRHALLAGWFLALCTVPSAGEGPGSPQQIRNDAYGDPLPSGAIARLGTWRFKIGDDIAEVALSPNGRIVAAATPYEIIHLLDAQSGRELRRFQADGNYRLAFSPDSTRLAIAGNSNHVQLWEVASGKLLRQLETGKDSGFSLSFSADGNKLASGPYEADAEPFVYVWNVATGKQLARVGVLQNQFVRVMLSADGRTLATWGSMKDRQGDGNGKRLRTIQVWDVATGKEIRRLAFDRGQVDHVALSPDGRTVAAINAGDKPTRAEKKPRSRLHFVDVLSDKELRNCVIPDDLRFLTFTYSSGGRLLAAATDKEERNAYLWDDTEGAFNVFQQPAYDLRTILFKAGGSILACGMENQWAIRIWDVRSGVMLSRSLGGHASRVDAASFAEGGNSLVTVDAEGHVLRWDLHPAVKMTTLREVRGWGSSYTLSSHAKYLACEMGPGCPYVCELDSGRVILDSRSEPKFCGSRISFSGNESFLAVNSGNLVVNEIMLWETSTGKRLRKLAWREGVLGVSAISSDGTKLAVHNKVEGPARGQSRFRMLLWDSPTSSELVSLTGDKEYVIQPVFSPDDRLLAMVGGPEPGIMIWDLCTRKQLQPLIRLTYWPRCMIFSPDGKTLAIPSDGGPGEEHSIKLIERHSGEVRRRFTGHQSIVLCLAFSPDGRTLASGGWDTTILLWDVTGLQQHGRLPLLHLNPNELEGSWKDLHSDNAATAYDALWRMVASPQETIGFLRGRLRPRPPVNPEKISRWIADLDSHDFATRRKATEELEKLAELAEPVVRTALGRKPSLETAQRLEHILDMLTPGRNLDQLRELRAVEVLEYIGTTNARELLASLAQGAPSARLTQEAKDALARMAKRGKSESK
jgi:WD40 repeat protein